jgi:1-acyl-sn-glycerol-3-phosphate acyltransferase
MEVTVNAQIARFHFRLFLLIFGITPVVYGKERLQHPPPDRGWFFLANYSSPLDPGILSAALPIPVSLLLSDRFQRLPIVGHISERMGNLHFPADRFPPSLLRGTKALLKGIRHLAAFPDLPTSGNSPNITGLVPPETASLVFHSGASFVPTAIAGSAEALPFGCWVPRTKPIRVLIGHPEPFPPFLTPPLRQTGRRVFAHYLAERVKTMHDILVHTPIGEIPELPPPNLEALADFPENPPPV